MGKKSKKGTVSVNMKDVEVRKVPPEGTYKGKIADAELCTSDSSGSQYIKWEVNLPTGAKVWNNTSLQPQALWNLRAWLEALGVEVPDDEMKLELSEYIGKELEVEIGHEMWEGKKKARIIDFGPINGANDSDDDDDDDDTASKDDEDDDSDDEDDDDEDDDDDNSSDDEDDLSAEDVNEMEEDELNEIGKKNNIRPWPPAGKPKTKRKLIIEKLKLK